MRDAKETLDFREGSASRDAWNSGRGGATTVVPRVSTIRGTREGGRYEN